MRFIEHPCNLRNVVIPFHKCTDFSAELIPLFLINGDEAVKAAEGMAEDINGVMGDLAHDMQTALPTDFDVNGSIRSAVDGVVGKAASAFTIALNITNFNNYSSEDIRQLTSEVMETANQFAQRKGVVFA